MNKFERIADFGICEAILVDTQVDRQLEHEAALCSTFSCLKTPQTGDSAGLQLSLSQNQIYLQMMGHWLVSLSYSLMKARARWLRWNLLTGRSVVRARPLSLGFPCLGNLEVSQPSCFLWVAWQLGTKRVLQLNDFYFIFKKSRNHAGSYACFFSSRFIQLTSGQSQRLPITQTLVGLLTEMAHGLGHELTDWKVRGSNPTSASRLLLSRSGHPDSIPDLALPSGGVAARHRKGVRAERYFLPLKK
ncbi:hypothetical protein CSKR_107423 [Clonorchis sinensis]|uniref:Uncharacterized protein n=1 Tax=Clonorchis sinensis TaxID=79923 RepID=A0A419PYU7_CLOSI|nr:hypothetical protein CSKR_107423 [Clonorchis sinensis]